MLYFILPPYVQLFFTIDLHWLSLTKDFYDSISTRKTQGESMLAWGIILGTIPVGIVGLLFRESIELNLRSYQVVAFATIFFGLLLGFLRLAASKTSIKVENIFVALIF